MPARGAGLGSILDCGRIEATRLERGLSQRELGRRIGATMNVVRGIESGRNHSELSLRVLVDLAAALEVEPAALFERAVITDDAGERAPEGDVRKLGAVFANERAGLSRETIARTLGWKLNRLDRALTRLNACLAEIGMSAEPGSTGWKLRPDLTTLAWDDELRLAQARQRERGLLLREAELLRAALDQPLNGRWEQHLGNADRVALGGLLKSGLVVRSEKGIEPSEAVRRSLPHIAGGSPAPAAPASSSGSTSSRAAKRARQQPRGQRQGDRRTAAPRSTKGVIPGKADL